MEASEIIRCRGHPLVSATHPTTFEVTSEEALSVNGHCIIGVAADKGAADLSAEFRRVICHDDAQLTTTLSCGGLAVVVRSAGSAAFTLTHPTDFVWRKSSFVCGRTIGIRSDTVAKSLPGPFVRLLQNGEELVVTLTATRPG
jgi:hypothetical protein